MKTVEWFHMEEDFCVGFVLMNDGKEIFITEEAVRFDAPLVTVCDSLKKAIERKWSCIDCLDEEEYAVYLKDISDITAEHEAAYRHVLLEGFLRIMNETFSVYKTVGMTSYKYDSSTHTMWLSKEDMETDHNYLWAAVDGALILWNTQHKPYYIAVDESAPDENGMIKYEFEIHRECED